VAMEPILAPARRLRWACVGHRPARGRTGKLRARPVRVPPCAKIMKDAGDRGAPGPARHRL